MNSYKIAILIFFVILSGCKHEKTDPLNWVDPMIGTDGTGHTFPGATVPFGMVQLSPSNDFKSWALCSGYHYADSTIKGFAHTHISGAGLTGLGDFLFMPTTGSPQLLPGSEQEPDSGYRSRFSHDKEHASPGYYQVYLDDYKVLVELTTGLHSGFHRYTFTSDSVGNVIIDPTHSVGESVLDAGIELLSDTTIRGYKKSSGDAGTPRTVFFYAKFSKPFSKYSFYHNGTLINDTNEASGTDVKTCVQFILDKGESIEAKVALSFVSYEGAKYNFDNETTHANFDRALNNAQRLWNEKLSKFEIEALTTEDKRTFYTAVYHSFISPNLISDADGKYVIEEIIYENDTSHFSTFSTWDTYRALHPLFSIVDQENNAKFINSLASRHHIQKVGLPLWEFIGHDNKCMIGYNAVSPMVEAVLKNNPNLNSEEIFEAITAAANNTDPAKSSVVYGLSGLEEYVKLHFVPAEVNTSVSKTTEQNYYDWCIAQLAKKLGKEEDYQYYLNRSIGYKQHFHPEKKLLWPKYSNGLWRDMDSTSWYDYEMNYVSGNLWGYSSYVPHDMEGLIDLFGGVNKFSQWMDDIFDDTAQLKGNQHVDISGFIGKYGHGDEPSHHMIYLYNFALQPWKTQELARRVMNVFYNDTPDGLVNNEDLGQMSAWYIFNAIGFYPVNPCSMNYNIGSPKFKKTSIKLENGLEFTVLAKNNSEKNVYIQSAVLNGEKIDRNYLKHEEIMQGGILELKMGNKPNYKRGTSKTSNPISLVKLSDQFKSKEVVPTPYDPAGKYVFQNSIKVSLSCLNQFADIYYTTDGSVPTITSSKYNLPLSLKENTLLKAVAVKKDCEPSLIMEQWYFKTKDILKGPDKAEVVMISPPDMSGEANGEHLFDGILASSYHTDKNWTVWQNSNAELIIRFDKKTSLEKLTITYLDHTGMEIFPPARILIEYSDNNEKYITLTDNTNIKVIKTLNPVIKRVEIPFKKIDAKAIRIKIQNYSSMPIWFKSYGKPAKLYLGEILIN